MGRIGYRLREDEVAWSAVRASGPGGQNVNKVSTAVRIVFDVRASSLPEVLKERILALRDRRVVRSAGLVTLKCADERTRARNLESAMERLRELIDRAADVPRVRRPTAPTRASVRRARKVKMARSAVKALRRALHPADFQG